MTRRWPTLLLVVVAALAVVAAPAGAQSDEGWTIRSYAVDLQVGKDGALHVTEQIAVDFRDLQRRGIFRYVPVWEELPSPLPANLREVVPAGADPDDLHRILRIEDLQVTSASGAPTDVQLSGPEGEGGNLVIRIGDPDVTVTGRQQYTLSYRVVGAVEPLADDGAGLAWDAVGHGWPVPIQQVDVTLTAPDLAGAWCFEGRSGRDDACEASTEGGRATFSSTRALQPGEGLTVAVQLPEGTVDARVLVDEKPSLRRSFIGSPWAAPLAAAVLVLGLAGVVALAWRQGRDRVHVGGVTSHGSLDEARAADRRRGLLEPRPVPVEYRPPDGLRPAQMGLLVDERVDAVDVTATVVDLAVRGHLVIEQVDEGGWFRSGDWRLVRASGAEDDELLAYERLLLDGLFADGDRVLVSDLKGTFARDYERVETAIYADAQSRRWFADRPDHVRSRWVGIGVFVAAAGVGLAFLLATWRMAVVGIAVALVGLVVAAAHRWMPRRTARGSALLTRTLGFREFVEAAETDRMAFAEAEELFVGYLPYAVVFGVVDRWAQVFEDLGVDVGSAVGRFYVGPGPFHLMAFSSGLNDFSSSVGSAVVAAPPSSGSGGFSSGGFGGGGGFSGGGMGGGGGGSW